MKINICFLLILVSIAIEAQIENAIPEALSQQLQSISKNHPSESVYLQTSKGIYETGEDLWFKGYILNSQYLTPSKLSETLYVQLVEEKNDTPVWQEKYEIKNGFVDGHIYIQDTLKSGDYALEAFTGYSFYDDKKEFKALRKLKILERITAQPKDTISLKEKDTVKKDSIHFSLFPEGGNLISGIESVVAFKAIDNKGLPIKASGVLYENNKKLLNIKTVHAGMGQFVMTPDITKNYQVKLDSAYANHIYELPTIQPKGKVLKLIANSNEALIFNVSQSKSYKKEIVYLRLQIRGNVYSIAKAFLNKTATIKIPLKDVPQGLAEVTLFDQDLQPIAERLLYVKQDQKLYIKAILDKGEYLTKEEAKIKLEVTDQNNEPAVAHLSMSVHDAIYNNPNDVKTIESHYNLSTQLKGNLYNPSYYFNEANTNRKKALNLLLLNQGWRRYVWNEETLKNTPKKHAVINDTVIGKVYAKKDKDNAILSQQYVMTFTADKNSPKSLIEIDSIGRFTVFPEYIKQAQGGYLYLKLINNSKKNLSITINDLTFSKINQIRKKKNISYPLYHQKKTALKIVRPFIVSNDINKLDEVMLKTKKKRVFRDKYIGSLDSLINLDRRADYLCHKGILNCPNHGASDRKPIPGQFYEQFSGRELVSLMYQKNYKRHYTVEELLRIFNIESIKGQYPKKEFYQPVYDIAEQIEGFPDYRNTLYWKPDIVTDKKGEATISFYCSDINSKFIGAIEGVSGEGNLGTQNFEFFVRKRN